MKTATDLRDEALAKVEENANKAWSDLVTKIIYDLATELPEFTSDDVWSELSNYPDIQTHQPAAMGAMFRNAAFRQEIRPTGSVVTSKRRSSHARAIRVWKSNVLEKK
jgi:oligoendopeptidase F